MHVEVVPDQHDDPAGQLAVRGDQQVPVLTPGERLGLALAAPVAVQPVHQPAAVAGPVAGQPGHRDVPGAAAADPDHRGDPAPRPGPGPRRPHRLAGLVFEDDPAAEGRRRAFIRAQVSFFHTSTAPSSRSIARRAPTWQVQPRRCSRYQIPGMVYCTRNLPGDQVADAGQRPPLVLVPGGQRPGLQRHIQRRQLLLIQPAPCGLPPGRQPGRAAGQPGLPPPPHRPLTDPQLSSDLRRRGPLPESLHGLQPDLLPAPSALGG